VVHPPTYAFAATVIASAALAAALAVRRQLHQLDLIAVLKARD
jgi:putative ABC transport system permease protein